MKIIDAKTGKTLLEHVRVAESPSDRLRGLIGTTGLAGDEGMFFPNCRMIHTFFMCMTIDAVFLDGSGIVLDIFRNLRPWRTAFCRQIGGKDTLELAAGRAAELGIEIGDCLKQELA